MAPGSHSPHPNRILRLLFIACGLSCAAMAEAAPPDSDPDPDPDPDPAFFLTIDRFEGLVNGHRFEPARALLDSLLQEPAPHLEVHRVLAIFFLRAGRPPQAAWDSVAARRPNDPGIAVGRAMSAVYAGARDEALDRFAAAARAFRGQAGALRFIELWRGMALAGFGDLAGARRALVALAQAAERARDRRVASRALSQGAEAAMRAGDYHEAERLAERAVELGRTADTARLLGRSLRTRGRLKQLRGDLAGARRDFEQALAAAELDPAARLHALKAIAGLEIDAGRYVAAFERLNEALDVADELRAPPLAAELYADLGLVEYRLGELAIALRHYERALAAGKPRALLYNRIGVIHAHQGRYEEALAAYERGLELARSARDRREEASILGHLGALHERLGESERAEVHYRAAVASLSAIGLTTEAAFHRHNLAALARRRGDSEQAFALLDTALAAFTAGGEQRGRARSLVLRADVLAARGAVAEALALLDSAHAVAHSIGDAIGVAEAAKTKGMVLLDQSPARAEAHFTEVRERAIEMGDPVLEAEAEVGLARVDARAGRGERAAAHYERALGRSEAVRLSVADDEEAATFLAQAQGIYHELVLHYARESRRASGGAGRGGPARDGVVARDRAARRLLGRAFATLERGRARALLDRLARGAPDESDRESARRRRELAEARLQALTSADPAARRRAWGRHDSLAAGLADRQAASSPRRFARRQPEPLGAEAVEDALAPGEVLVAYSLGPDSSLALVLGEKERQAIAVPGERELERRVTALLDQIRHPDPLGAAGQPELARLARSLHADLVAPLPITAARRLLILPDGILHHLPFEVLAGDRELLVERCEVAYAPSASTWARLRDRQGEDRKQPGRAAPPAGRSGRGPALRTLALADPRPARALPVLGGARFETEAIVAALGPSAVEVRRGEEAAESYLKSERARGYAVVHLAAHAVADDRKPEDCALELAPGGGEDGRLTADEAYDLELGAELVVLSGCETALGREVRGEGIFGLGRAFLRAGARAVIASLWPVPDRATAELMASFYARLAAGASAAAALRAAKVARVEAGRHPFEWAGFVLIGGAGMPGADGSDRRPLGQR